MAWQALIASVGKKHVVVHTGKEKVIEQARMFKNARVVVGAHGAGLTNIVYCKPGTGVVLLPMKPHSDHTYSHMASALGQSLCVRARARAVPASLRRTGAAGIAAGLLGRACCEVLRVLKV